MKKPGINGESFADIDFSLPDNIDAERFVLGAILSDRTALVDVAPRLTPDDFSLEKHKRIYQRMLELQERGESIDRVTLANELMNQGQLQSVDGLSYLVSLDDGLPKLYNLDSYVDIVREKSLRRQIIKICHVGALDAATNFETNGLTLLGEVEEQLSRVNDSSAKVSSLQNPTEIIVGYEGGLNAFLDPKVRQGHGLRTGFTKFDDMTGGLREGELFILAARPAMGKSALALNISQQVAGNRTNPKAVAVFSLEMSKESLLTRLICAAARVDQQRFRAGYLNLEERASLRHAASEIADAPLFIDDTASTSLMDVHAKLRRLKQDQDLGLVVIDYLQLMQGRGRFEGRVQEVSTLSRGFKMMAKELRVPFMVLSQLSRAPETRPGDHRPMLSDLRESGSIEQDADMVAFIFREEMYRPDKESLKGIAELILAKQRNGPTGRIKLAFLNRFTLFQNFTYEDEQVAESMKPFDGDDDGYSAQSELGGLL